MNQPQANKWIHTLGQVLNLTLGYIEELPAREGEETETFADEDGDYWHDGTERPINRPLDNERQKEHYRTAYVE